MAAIMELVIRHRRAGGIDDPPQYRAKMDHIHFDQCHRAAGHRDNMLSREFTVTGVGVCVRGTMYYFTQIFMRLR